MSEPELDLLVIGAGPTGISIGAAARAAGFEVLLVERGPLCGAMVDFPTDMRFFTTRDLLEIAGVPFSIPDEKPNRRQALTYYQGVVRSHGLSLALFEEVADCRRQDGAFTVTSRGVDGQRQRRAWAVVVATGYFGHPRRLGVEGENQAWVSQRYREPYPHFAQRVAVIGGGNSACETALDLWRNGARVTLIHRRQVVKPSIKYWLRPDIENRIEEGSIDGLFETRVETFADHRLELCHAGGRRSSLAVDAAYVLIGYLPDVELQRRFGIEIDPESLVPTVDPRTCQSNIPGLYIAGTLQAGRDTGKIFIENSRDHGARIVAHLIAQRAKGAGVAVPRTV